MVGLANFTIIVGRSSNGIEQFRCTWAQFCEGNADSIAETPHDFAAFVDQLNKENRSGPWFGLGDPDEYLIFDPDDAPPVPAAALKKVGDDEAPDFPDISELTATIEQAEAALAEGQKMLCGNDFTDDRSLFQATPFYAPLKACRDILSDIRKAEEAFSS